MRRTILSWPAIYTYQWRGTTINTSGDDTTRVNYSGTYAERQCTCLLNLRKVGRRACRSLIWQVTYGSGSIGSATLVIDVHGHPCACSSNGYCTVQNPLTVHLFIRINCGHQNFSEDSGPSARFPPPTNASGHSVNPIIRIRMADSSLCCISQRCRSPTGHMRYVGNYALMANPHIICSAFLQQRQRSLCLFRPPVALS